MQPLIATIITQPHAQRLDIDDWPDHTIYLGAILADFHLGYFVLPLVADSPGVELRRGRADLIFLDRGRFVRVITRL